MKELAIAGIAFLGVVLTPIITGLFQRSYLHKNLGKANGQGTVTDMLERILHNQSEHEVLDDLRFGAVNKTVKGLRSEVAALHARLDQGPSTGSDAPSFAVTHDEEPPESL